VNILDTIVEQKRREVAALPGRPIAAGDLRDALLQRDARRDFLAALRHPQVGNVALIAEVKKASPSAGVICPDFDPVRIAREYDNVRLTPTTVLISPEGRIVHYRLGLLDMPELRDTIRRML
jgi:indole-3-glycerol phosphate synthase